MGAPFVPTLAYAGSDVIKRRPDDFTIALTRDRWRMGR
jgi:hypothetical protein